MKKLIIAALVTLACSSAYATQSEVQKQIDDLRSGLHDVHMNTLQKYSESWGLEDRANIAKMQENKLDKSVFTADQQRQTTELKTYTDKKADSAYSTSVAHTDSKVARADADRAKGDTALQNQITKNLSSQATRDEGQDDHINAVQNAAQIANEKGDALAVRADGIEHQAGVLDGRVGNVEVRADKLEDGQRVQDVRLDNANANIQANRESLNRANQVVSQHSAELANHEQRIGELEQNTNRNFAGLRDKVERNKKDADAGIAGVAAMVSIPQVTEYQTFAVGAGVGSRHDQQALALGFSARAAQNVVVKVSAATDSNSSWTVGAGASIGW